MKYLDTWNLRPKMLSYIDSSRHTDYQIYCLQSRVSLIKKFLKCVIYRKLYSFAHCYNFDNRQIAETGWCREGSIFATEHLIVWKARSARPPRVCMRLLCGYQSELPAQFPPLKMKYAFLKRIARSRRSFQSVFNTPVNLLRYGNTVQNVDKHYRRK